MATETSGTQKQLTGHFFPLIVLYCVYVETQYGLAGSGLGHLTSVLQHWWMHPNGHSVLSIILFLFIVIQSADGAGGQVGGTGHSHLSSHLVGQTLSALMWEYLYIGLHPSLVSGHWGRGGHRLSQVVSHLTAHTFVPIFSYTRDARQLGEPEL